MTAYRSLSDQRQLDQVFHALADATRRDILLRIGKGTENVSDIASHYRMSLPAVSKHLGVLERAGLLVRRKKGRERRCHVEPDRLKDALSWLEFYSRFWDERLDNLKQLLERDPGDSD